MPAPIQFELLAVAGRARRGRIATPHGVIETPAFMPVGTRAAVKGVSPAQLAETGSQVVLANTYHLALRPGAEIVAAQGGLHRWMNWDRPILTDSGGFQVFSLADLRRLDDDGVEFRSHIDGALLRLTPERSIEIQNQLGADIIMCFDECPPLGRRETVEADRGSARAPAENLAQQPTSDASPPLPAPGSASAALRVAVARTVRWAARCKAAQRRADQALYGIVQGGLDLHLRRECLGQLREIGFEGYAIGGLSVGEPQTQMWALLDEFADELPRDRPRYLMGVGTPRDLVEAVSAGIDQFDCVLPTRNGRKGYAFTSTGTLRLRNASHRTSSEPLDPACGCPCCRGFSRSYLRHLLTSDEALGATLVSIHNLSFYQGLMARMRAAIERGEFASLRRALLAGALGASHDESET